MNGNVVQKNHPTVGGVPGGATVEVGVSTQMVAADNTVTFVLGEPDYTTASRVAAMINSSFGAATAEASDAAESPSACPTRARPLSLLTDVENLSIEPRRRAKVVITDARPVSPSATFSLGVAICTAT